MGQEQAHDSAFGDEEAPEVVEELLTAGQALILVAIIVGIALTYAYRFWKRMEEDRNKESFIEYDFELPKEREQFNELLKKKPEEKPENREALQRWHLALCKTLFHRVMKVIDLHDQVHQDHRTQTALYKRGVAVYMLPQIEHAKELVNNEVQECGMTANKLKPKWGTTIFQEAYKMRAMLKEREQGQTAPEPKKDK